MLRDVHKERAYEDYVSELPQEPRGRYRGLNRWSSQMRRSRGTKSTALAPVRVRLLEDRQLLRLKISPHDLPFVGHFDRWSVSDKSGLFLEYKKLSL